MAALPFCRVRLRGEKPKSSAYLKELKTFRRSSSEAKARSRTPQKEVALQLGVDSKTLTNLGKSTNRAGDPVPASDLPVPGRRSSSRARFLSFPERLRAARTAQGLSQEAMASHLGIDPRTVARWESGKGRPRGRLSKLLADGWAGRACPGPRDPGSSPDSRTP